MDASVIVLSIVVLLLAVASAVLGFIAETTTLNPLEIHYSDWVCVYPAKPAYALGICAAALLAAAQIIASVAGVCGCVKPQGGGALSPKRKKQAVGSAVLSWIFAVAALASYAQGVEWNAATARPASTDGRFIKCQYLMGAVFRRAALLGLAAAVLGICAYAILRQRPAAAGDEPKPDGQQPAVGEAQNAQQFAAPPTAQVRPYSQVV